MTLSISDDEKASELYWQHQDKLWRADRIQGGGGHMSVNGFVKGEAWIPEIDVLPRPVSMKRFLQIDQNSPLGRDLKRRSELMAYETNNMSGSLFKNDKKVEGSNQPDYRGTIKINDVEYWQSAWVKTSASGVKFMSFAYQLKEEQPAAAPAQSPKQEDSDIPF
jgi:hypothetical protein